MYTQDRACLVDTHASYLGMRMVIMIEITTKLSTARELPGDEVGDNCRVPGLPRSLAFSFVSASSALRPRMAEC